MSEAEERPHVADRLRVYAGLTVAGSTSNGRCVVFDHGASLGLMTSNEMEQLLHLLGRVRQVGIAEGKRK